MVPQKLAFVDLETTGTSAQYDRIIEVGILRVEDGIVTDTFSSLINPQLHIPPYITTITGISAEDVSHAPSFASVADEISNILDDCVFVAHNVRFDYSFLKHEFARTDKQFSKRHFCTVRLSRLLYPQHKKHNLDSIIERFNIPCKNRHRAFDDAAVLVEFFSLAQKQLSEKIFTNAVKLALKQPSLPSTILKEDVSSLPESPGVYIFFGENNMPLYIGKSVNVKDRVLSHFASDINSQKEMNITRQITTIKTYETAGELGALFLESQLIKKHLPLYNRRLRYARELVVLKESQTAEGYSTVSLSTLTSLTQKDLTDPTKILGIFRSKKDAKAYLTAQAKDFTLCEKLLGLEKTKTACFSRRLGTCNGACEQVEKPLFYNLRFTTAFIENRISAWPFNGPICITEKNPLTGLTEKFILDKWCLLGSIQEKKDADTIINEDTREFDLDTYKILKSYLKHKKHGISIERISPEVVKILKNETLQSL